MGQHQAWILPSQQHSHFRLVRFQTHCRGVCPSISQVLPPRGRLTALVEYYSLLSGPSVRRASSGWDGAGKPEALTGLVVGPALARPRR